MYKITAPHTMLSVSFLAVMPDNYLEAARMTHVDKDFQVGTEPFEGLKSSIRENGVKIPLQVRFSKEKGEERYLIQHGMKRLLAHQEVRKLMSESAQQAPQWNKIPCFIERTKEYCIHWAEQCQKWYEQAPEGLTVGAEQRVCVLHNVPALMLTELMRHYGKTEMSEKGRLHVQMGYSVTVIFSGWGKI